MTTTDLQHLAALLAPAQAARTQQRYAEQRGGRARRAAGKLRGRPLFDDAARLLLTLIYQRQICSMTVLADLLEVTDTCIGSLVHQTREVLEDHRYSPTIASMRFATAHDLLAFLDQDLRPARTAIIHTLSDPASPAGAAGSCTSSPSASRPGRPPTPSGAPTSDAAAPGRPAPPAASSPTRSATANLSC